MELPRDRSARLQFLASYSQEERGERIMATPSPIRPRSIATHLPVAKTPSVRRAFGTAVRQPTTARLRRSTKWALASPLRAPPTRPYAASN